MFTVFKVRKDQKPGDYSDPGSYAHPPGTSAFEYTGTLAEPARFQSEVKAGGQPVTGLNNPPREADGKAVSGQCPGGQTQGPQALTPRRNGAHALPNFLHPDHSESLCP